MFHLPPITPCASSTGVDCTNPIGPGFRLLHGHTDSGAEAVARQMPGVRVV